MRHLLIGLAAASLFGLFCLARLLGPVDEQLIPTSGVALVVFVLAATFPRSVENNPVLRFFAGISFPLYVIHAVLGYVVMRVLIDLGVDPTLATMAAVVVAIGVAMGLHATVETWSQRRGGALAKQHWPLAAGAMEGRP